jgi:hypothetical protein
MVPPDPGNKPDATSSFLRPVMTKSANKASLCARVEAHASMLEAAAALMELDGIGLAPDLGHVHHLRCMAGAIRAQAVLGVVAQSYSGGRYLPDPARSDSHEPTTAQRDTPWH